MSNRYPDVKEAIDNLKEELKIAEQENDTKEVEKIKKALLNLIPNVEKFRLVITTKQKVIEKEIIVTTCKRCGYGNITFKNYCMMCGNSNV